MPAPSPLPSPHGSLWPVHTERQGRWHLSYPAPVLTLWFPEGPIGLGSRTYQLVNIDQQGETAASRQIKLTAAGQECFATLYDNPSADDLYNALPLELTFEDYNQTEKIIHPPKTLTTEGMPDSFDPDVGDLCLYAPWGNLCIFYRDFRNSTSLIPLGHIDSGMDVIGGMTEDFTVTMEAIK